MARSRRLIGTIAAATLFGGFLLAGPGLAAPPPLEAYGNLPKTERLDLSPNGELFARISTEGENRVLVVERVAGGVLMTASVGDTKIAGLDWVNDDELLVYLHSTLKLTVFADAQEFLQAVVVDVKGKKLQWLLKENPSYLAAVFGEYGYAQLDGNWYGYFGLVPLDPGRDPSEKTGFFKQQYPDLYRVDLKSGTARSIAAGNSKLPRWVLDEQGQVLAYSSYENRAGEWGIYRAGSSTPVASGHADFGFNVAGRGRTPRTVAFIHPDNNKLTEINLDDGGQLALSDEPIEHLIEAPGSHLLIGMTIAGEYPKTVMFDSTLARHMEAIARGFPGDSVELRSISADHSKIVVYVEGSRTAGTWQLVDFNTGKAEPLADAYPIIPDEMLAEVRVIDYRAGDGLAIKGILTLPPGRDGHNLPLVVMPHGGPESMDKVGFDWWAQAFASRGYAVFQPNFRGSSGHGTAFRDAGFGQYGRRMQTDISDGVGELVRQGLVDPSRVCIVGASYGGYAALAGVTLQHGLYKCAASYGGISDPGRQLGSFLRKKGYQYAGAGMRYLRSYMTGAKDGFSSVSDDISPLAHAAEADAPVLLIHGEDDTVVLIEQSERMDSALRRAGKPVEFIKLKSEDHWLSRSATRLQMLQATVSFVEKYNPAYSTTH